MIKVFRHEVLSKNWYEVRIFNMETGEFTHYYQDKNIGYPFSEYTTTAVEMGYKSINDCLKELKNRWGSRLGQEIDYKEQRQSEKIGWINLGVERIKRAKRMNTNDFEDVIQKLSKYGLGYCDAQNQITACYLYSLEQV